MAALALYRGAQVIGTSRTAWKRARLLEVGVAAALDWRDDDFTEQVLALTDGRGVDAVIDNIGNPRMWGPTMAVLATCGTVVSSGTLGRGDVQFNLRQVYLRNQRIIGVRTAGLAHVHAIWNDVRCGFRPFADAVEVFALTEAAAAHTHIEQDESFGRVALTVD